MAAELNTSLGRLTAGRAAALVVALAPLLYFLPATRGRLVLCPDDAIIFNLPLRAAAAQIVSGGHLPLWNPYIFGGMPLHAAAQGGLLFPLNWFFLLFRPQEAMNLAVLASYSLAGLGAYLYARRTGTNVAGALFTGLVWQMSGFLVAQIGHTNVVHAATLVPWLLWSIEAYAAEGTRARAALVAALVALQTFAGHQQALTYTLLLAGAYAACMALRAEEGRTRRAYLFSILMLLVGLVLAAAQILPTAELTRNSVRAEASYEFFGSFSMPPRLLLTFFAPYVLGGGDGTLFRAPYVEAEFYGEYIGYVGAAPLALALVAALVLRDRVTHFWTVAALVALALALGRFWPFDLYRLIYYVPVLNLFRVPARHLMEVDFALAVLAGRAVSALPQVRERQSARLVCLAVVACLLLLTCLTVTAWRPAEFRLGREAPVTVLRAPELFMPVVVVALSAWAVWRFARGRRRATLALFVVAVFDLCLWGQTSGWRVKSPRRDSELWRTTAAVELLRAREGMGTGKYRILTTPAPFVADAPAGTVAARQASGQFILTAQPNTYMLHGVENAAGYDGFGLARYGRLAGDMKLWGELTDPEATLRGESRAVDVLGVRYLLTPSEQASLPEMPRAPTKLADFMFAEKDIGLTYLEDGAAVRFDVPSVEATRVALLTNLAWSEGIAEGATVGRVRLRADFGREFAFDLRAGRDTSEWAHDRLARSGRAMHARARVGTSSTVSDPEGAYESHAYVTSFALPEKARIVGVSVEVARLPEHPKLSLGLQRVSLIDEAGGATVPLVRQWLSKETEAGTREGTKAAAAETPNRWRRLARAGDLWVYEREGACPRAWLANELVALPDEASLEVIRTGRLPDGRAWEPLRTALANGTPSFNSGDAGGESRAEITRHEPNRVEVKTNAAGQSVLVLSENHYPGWRAYLDGRSVETIRVNYNLRGVALTPGAHEVIFLYRPKSVIIGVIVSLLTAAALLLWWQEERARRLFTKTVGRWGRG